MNVLLVSTYELGHQSFSLAHVAALLRDQGHSVCCLDLAIESFDGAQFQSAEFIAFSVPMHTAARLTARLLYEVKQLSPAVPVAAFGLYAQMNRRYFSSLGVSTILGGEFEAQLVDVVNNLQNDIQLDSQGYTESHLAKQSFTIPDRKGLPLLSEYATLQLSDGGRKTVGYTESSRGCKHHCAHCPVVPVYQGKFRAIPLHIVLADIRQQVNSGAEHITFGDPDFFNGPTHGLRVIEAVNREFPQLTYDVTIKVEHLLSYSDLIPRLKQTGCAIVTTAVESVDNQILTRFAKGHTREDFYKLVELCRQYDLNLSPTFVPFTPWTSVEGYLDLLKVIVDLDLLASISPVQLSIRLLIPPGSYLLHSPEVQLLIGPEDSKNFIYPWKHENPLVDQLQRDIAGWVQKSSCQSRYRIFSEIWALTHKLVDIKVPKIREPSERDVPPHLSEPWYCCAEPTEDQFNFV